MWPTMRMPAREQLSLQRIWRDGVGTMGRIWDAAFSEQVG